MVFGFKRAASEGRPADVSVVIPVYNHESFVVEAIQSVLVQTSQPREIICIDDGSTDGSAGRVEHLARRQASLRFWSRPNQGAARTLNEGIQAATSRYIAILNSDDLYHPTRLARCLAVLEADPNVAVVASEICFLDGEGRSIANPWYDNARNFYREVGDLGLALVNGNFLMTTSNVVARRSLFEEVGGFDELRYAHDLDFFLRLVVHGRKVTVLGQPLLAYRFHGSNTISESAHKVKVEWAAATAFFARRLSVGRDPERRGPKYLRRLLEVTDHHQLTGLVTQVLLYVQGDQLGPERACRELRRILKPGGCHISSIAVYWDKPARSAAPSSATVASSTCSNRCSMGTPTGQRVRWFSSTSGPTSWSVTSP